MKSEIDTEGYWSISFSEANPNAYWNCLCDCGRKSKVIGYDLRSGKSLKSYNNASIISADVRQKNQTERNKTTW